MKKVLSEMPSATLALAIAAMVIPVWSQANEVPVPGGVTEQDEVSLSLPDQGQYGMKDELITLALDEVPMEDVIRIFMRIPGANFIAVPSNLVGEVTVNLTDVPWKPALVSILRSHNLELMEITADSGIYSIEHRKPDAPEPLEVETVFLSFATVKEVETAIQPVLLPEARLSLFPSRNALVIKTTAANMREVRNVISEIDRMREQVFIEAKFMELNDDAIQNLGINWQGLRGIGLSAGGINWTYEMDRQRGRSSVWTDGHYDRESTSDRRTPRYDADGNQIEQSTTSFIPVPGTDQYIVEQQVTPTRAVDRIIEHGRSFEHEIQDIYQRTAQDVRSAILGVTDFNIILSALRETAGVSIVSNPKIIVANEEKATIHIGQTERPFVSTVTPATQTTAPFTTYNPGDPVEFGVKLDVTPTVNTASNISLLIEPTLTRFVRDAVAPTGQTYPVIARKTISTRFTLEDGKTVAIGGLTETTDSERVSRVPILGSIPLIGRYLFSHSRKERNQTETVIFVTVGMATPGTITEDQGLPRDTHLARQHLLRERLRRHDREQEIEVLRQAVEEKLQPDTSYETEAEAIEPDQSPEDSNIAEEVRRAFGHDH